MAPDSSSRRPPDGPAGAPSDRTRQARARGEQRAVAALLLALTLAALLLAGVSVRATVVAGNVEARAGGAIGRASLAQMEFQARHRRFALWDELLVHGVRLPAAMAVDASSATPSHWYLRLKDSATGITCDGIGTLTDEPGAPVRPTCRRP